MSKATQAALAFFQLRKVDEEQRLVYGRAVQEVPDRVGEIMDYESSKPLFEAWSKSQQEASLGKSAGNVRSMHKADTAAGIVVPGGISFHDTDKAIDVCVKVTDDQEWQKVLSGTYTGFSVGGSYAKKWEDPELKKTRYTAAPSELSLVDRPCIPTAKFFDIQKADGSVLQKAFAETEKGDAAPKKGDKRTMDGEEQEYDGEQWAPCAKVVTLGEMTKVLLDAGATADELNALTFDGLRKRYEEQLAKGTDAEPADVDVFVPGTAEQVDELLKVLAERKWTFGDALALVKVQAERPAAPPAAPTREELNARVAKAVAGRVDALKPAEAELQKVTASAMLDELRKNLATSCSFASLLQSLDGLCRAVEYEALMEQDGSALPTNLRKWVAGGAALLSDMARETASEMADNTEVMALADRAGALVKHLGEETMALAKAAPAPAEELAKVQAERDALSKSFTEQAAQVKQMGETLLKVTADLELLKRQPAGGIRLRAVDKGQDVTELQKSEPEPVKNSHGEKQDAATLIKSLHQQGGQPLLKLD